MSSCKAQDREFIADAGAQILDQQTQELGQQTQKLARQTREWDQQTQELARECEAMSCRLEPERVRKIDRVLKNRLYGLTVVMEGLTDPHNISASMRAAEALGVHDIHVVMSIENRQFTPHNAVSSGAHKWLNIHMYRDCSELVPVLKNKGFSIYVSSAGPGSVLMEELEIPDRVALVFGNEKDGVSSAMMEAADAVFWQSFPGFTQTLNVSVATALCLQKARDMGWGAEMLSAREKLRTKHKWYSSHFSDIGDIHVDKR